MQFFIHCNFFCQEYKFTYILSYLLTWLEFDWEVETEMGSDEFPGDTVNLSAVSQQYDVVIHLFSELKLFGWTKWKEYQWVL